jgi:hypothetical protein
VNAILEMARHKVANGGKARRLIVAGCLVERYRDEIQRNIPEVDAVVGTGELESILEAAGLTAPAASSGSPSPFNILVSCAASAVHQHSHPSEVGAQLGMHLGAPHLGVPGQLAGWGDSQNPRISPLSCLSVCHSDPELAKGKNPRICPVCLKAHRR